MTTLKTMALAVALTATTALAAVAAPIPLGSNFGMSGAFEAKDNTGTVVAFTAATRIDFFPSGSFPGTGGFNPTAATTGAFEAAFNPISGAGAGLTGTIADLQFVGFPGATAPLAPFWTITNPFGAGAADDVTASFDITSLSINTQTDAAIVLTGTGTMHLTGYDATLGTWSFSGNTSGGQTTGTFSWSADSTPIPEPATLGLLGAGLIGFAALRRARRARA